MNVLLITLLTFVAVTGGFTVMIREPVRQAIMAGVLGLLLSGLFFALQAPDVALSEIVIGGGAIPIMLLLAIGKIRRQDAAAEQETSDE